MNIKWLNYITGFTIAILLSGFSSYFFDYFYSRGVYSLGNRMGSIEYAGLQFVLLLPLVFVVSKRRYIAAFVFLIGFIIGNYIFINPTAEDNLHRSYFEFFCMLATIAASYVIGWVAQFSYSHMTKRTR